MNVNDRSKKKDRKKERTNERKKERKKERQTKNLPVLKRAMAESTIMREYRHSDIIAAAF